MELAAQVPFHQVDAFTDRPFHRNPAAVFLPSELLDPRAIQLMAHAPTLLDVNAGDGMLGVAVTAPGSDGADFVSRFFAPWIGIPEDPVTGLAHTALAPYWSKLLTRERLQACQLSAGEGDVGVEVRSDQVLLYGRAATIARGTMVSPLLETAGSRP